MNQEHDPLSFRREFAHVASVVDISARLPDQVFLKSPDMCRFVESDVIWSQEWFDSLQTLTRESQCDRFSMLVSRPDPEDYYFSHFRKFPLFQFGESDSFMTYSETLNMDPGGSPADAIRFNADVLLIYPPRLAWVIYCDRDLELGLVAAMNDAAILSVNRAFAGQELLTPGNAIDSLLPAVFGGAVPDQIRWELLYNYASSRA